MEKIPEKIIFLSVLGLMVIFAINISLLLWNFYKSKILLNSIVAGWGFLIIMGGVDIAKKLGVWEK